MARQVKERHAWPVRGLPLVAWMALIFILSAQPDLPHPAQSWLDLVLSSGAHVLLFGVLAFLWRWVLDGQKHARVLALLLTLVYGASDEFHQSFVPGRSPDLFDLVCDSLGAVLGLVLWDALRRLRIRR